MTETFNEKQTDTLLKVNLLGFYPFHVGRCNFRTLNRELISLTPWISYEDIQYVLADQPTSKAYRLIGRGMTYHSYSELPF
jgi:hypothetical protein